MGGEARKMDAPRAQFDEEEHVDGLQPDGFYREEISSQDLVL